MVTAPVLIALLGIVTAIATVVACVATLRARAARVELRARDRQHGESVELARTMAATRRLAGDVARDVTDLLTAITRRAELLIAGLDPSGASIQDAHEIRRDALSAAKLTKPLRALSGSHHESEPAALPDPTLKEPRLTVPVLVVEDEPQVRELIRLVLVRAGHEVVAVAGPRAALVALNRQPAIPLILVDVVMPEMDGYDLAAEARKISPGVRVVFMSAFAHDALRHPKADGFLAKPFTIEALTGIVEKGLSR
jgi:CheY-like chemotaxis protein